MNKKIKKIITISLAVILFIVSALILSVYLLINASEKERFADAVFYNSPIEQKKKILGKTSEILKLDFPASTELIFAHPEKGDLENMILVFAEKLCMSRDDLKSFDTQIFSNNGSKYYVDEDVDEWYIKHSIPRKLRRHGKESKLFKIVYNKQQGVPLCMIKTCYEKGQGVVYMYYGAF